MLIKVIEVYDKKVIINDAILNVPEFKALYEKSGVEPFQFLWALFDPESPYMNYTEDEREDKVAIDFPINQNDPLFLKAYRKCQDMYTSPIRRLLRGAKASIESLALYLETTSIEHGKDGNLSQVIMAQKSLPQIIKSFQATEEAYKNEVQKSRGYVQIGFDELDDD